MWCGLWVLAFSLNALMLRMSIALHGSYSSSLILGLRDLILLVISFVIWRRWFPERWKQQNSLPCRSP